MLDFLEWVVKFLVLTIGLKMIVGHWIAERVMIAAKTYFGNIDHNARYRAIWDHYQQKAMGQGHAAKEILDCGEGKCNMFSI